MLYHAIIIPQIKLRCFIDRHVDPDVLKVSDYILDICLRSKAAENHSIIQNIVFISEEKALIAAPFHNIIVLPLCNLPPAFQQDSGFPRKLLRSNFLKAMPDIKDCFCEKQPLQAIFARNDILRRCNIVDRDRRRKQPERQKYAGQGRRKNAAVQSRLIQLFIMYSSYYIPLIYGV